MGALVIVELEKAIEGALLSKQAIQDAMEVAFLFNIYDRLSDAMGWDVPPVAGGFYQVSARGLLKHGYI